MKEQIEGCVIVGSSRGLGAALVDEFLSETSYQILGLARTNFSKIKCHDKWIVSQRYRHVEIDIASSHCREALKSIALQLPPKPICLIFNSAHIEKDINEDQSINFSAFDRVNRVGVIGLGNVLFAFEEHLLKYGGIVVGISSFWGAVAPLYLPWIAYPASKAYLNMVTRCLRVAWRKNVQVMAVNIGNLEEAGKDNQSNWIAPTYRMAAKKIVRSVLGNRIPESINYPLWHSIVYLYILKFVPKIVYSWVFRSYFFLESLYRKRS